MEEHLRIKQLVFNRPWAVTEDYMEVVAEVVSKTSLERAAGRTIPINRDPKPLLRMERGVPIITVDGVISKKMNLFSDVSGGTSIEQLDSAFSEAMKTDAHATILQFDSPGGGVPGVAEFSTRVFEARSSGKTIISIADNMAASAAAWIATQADEVYVTEAGSVGSIGIVARILDDTRAMKNAGIDPIIFRTGELKAAGMGPMTPAQENSVIRECLAYFDKFKAAIFRARPQANMDELAKGGMYIGTDAVNVGLADGISTLDRLVARYARKSA